MSREPIDDQRPGLSPPRFGLRALMWCVTLLAVLFALMAYVGAHATVLLVLFVLAVVAHVAGNAIGTQLRKNGNTRLLDESGRRIPGPAHRPVSKTDFAPATRLRRRESLGWPIVLVTGAGILLGGLIGGFSFAWLPSRPVAWPSITGGVVATAVLCGIWTFLGVSFVQVTCSAAWQAIRDKRD